MAWLEVHSTDNGGFGSTRGREEDRKTGREEQDGEDGKDGKVSLR
jgi:hypothetical protein